MNDHGRLAFIGRRRSCGTASALASIDTWAAVSLSSKFFFSLSSPKQRSNSTIARGRVNEQRDVVAVVTSFESQVASSHGTDTSRKRSEACQDDPEPSVVDIGPV
jgi:hypothetical protein